MIPDIIDISHHQAKVDFKKIKAAGVQGVWLKATDGSSMVDPTFATRKAAAKAAGLHVGAYHFAHPVRSSATVQAKHFLSVIGAPEKGVDLRAALDLEFDCGKMTGPQVVAWIDEFLTVLHAKRWQTITYSYEPYSKAHGFDDHPSYQWRARYSSTPPKGPWKVWQYTDKAAVPGISSPVDGDRLAPGLTIDAVLTK